VGLPALLLFPAVLPHVLTALMNLRRVKGKIGGAKVKFEWPAFVTLQVNDVTLTNPPGFEHEHMVALKMARGTVNIWSLFTKSIKMGAVEVHDVDVFIERQKNKGMNVSAYVKQTKGQVPLIIADGEEEGVDTEDESNFVLSLLGMVTVKTDRVAENFAKAVEADGGVGNFAKNTTTNVISGTWGKLSNVVGFTTEILTSKAKSLESDVKKAGGIDKWAINTTQTVATAVSDKTKEGYLSVQDGGIQGAATFATDNVTSAVGTVASTANNTLLQQALHRKIMGCYSELVESRYIDLTLVQIKGLKVDARKLFGSDETGNAIFLASEAALREADLVPHPKALRKDGLPIRELQRRVEVIINYAMRKENTGAVFKTVTPNWLLPKKGAGAGSYIQDVSKGVSGLLSGVAKTGFSAVEGAGSHFAAVGKTSAHSVMKTNSPSVKSTPSATSPPNSPAPPATAGSQENVTAEQDKTYSTSGHASDDDAVVLVGSPKDGGMAVEDISLHGTTLQPLGPLHWQPDKQRSQVARDTKGVTAEAGRIGGSLTNAAVGTVSSVVDVAGSAVEAASGAAAGAAGEAASKMNIHVPSTFSSAVADTGTKAKDFVSVVLLWLCHTTESV